MRTPRPSPSGPVRSTALKLIGGLLLLGSALGLHAQQVYRIVGPDGRVSFSDRPPMSSDSKTSAASAGARSGSSPASLPYELREVVSRFPVTLYTGTGCQPCSAGRALLTQRGVPFTERTVNSNDDATALVKLSGDNSLPFITIGRQQLKGFSDVEWKQYLDAAGYPTSNQLPSAYRNPDPAPLVASKTVGTTAENAQADGGSPAAAASSRRTAPPTPPTPPSNPAGIRF